MMTAQQAYEYTQRLGPSININQLEVVLNEEREKERDIWLAVLRTMGRAGTDPERWNNFIKKREKMLSEVAALTERKACAEIAADWSKEVRDEDNEENEFSIVIYGDEIADEIMARGKKES